MHKSFFHHDLAIGYISSAYANRRTQLTIIIFLLFLKTLLQPFSGSEGGCLHGGVDPKRARRRYCFRILRNTNSLTQAWH